MNNIDEVATTSSDIRANTMPRRELGRKRVAVDEISERHHIRLAVSNIAAIFEFSALTAEGKHRSMLCRAFGHARLRKIRH